MDYDSPEWYEAMERWSENAGSAGDVETMLIAEIAMRHKINIDRYALSPGARARIRRILAAPSPRLAACEEASVWGDPWEDP